MGPAEPERLLAGRYRFRSVIGRGGMGVVWRARDELLGRDVAVKEIIWPPQMDTAERDIARRRALREAQMAARLSHPNVVGVYDIVEEDGRPWLVMELVPYRSLRDAIATDGPLSPARAAQVGLGILAALRAAHEAGVLHRDVKPANVLLAPEGRVVLTDFGIARADDSPALTGTGVLVGSPSYISPERARGERATAAGDMWALGACLYAAVEGRPPFDREGALASLTAVVTDEPDPPSRAGPLWPVISGLLHKDPAARPGADDVEAMLRALSESAEPAHTAPLPEAALPDAPPSAPSPPGEPPAPLAPDEAAAEPGARKPAEPGARKPAKPRARKPAKPRARKPAEPGPSGLAAEPVPSKTAAEPVPPELAAAPAPDEPGPRDPTAEPAMAGNTAPSAPDEPAAEPVPAGPAIAPGPREPAVEPALAGAAAEPGPPVLAAEPGPPVLAAEPGPPVAAAKPGPPLPAAEPGLPGPAGPSAGPARPVGTAGPTGPSRSALSGAATGPVAGEAVPRPAPPPADRSQPPGHRRSRAALAATAAVAVIAAGVIAGLIASAGSPHHLSASHTAASSPAPRASATRPATAAATPSPSGPAASSPATPGGTSALPAGYYRFTNSTGFSIGVPAGWQISHVGHYVYIRDPADSGIFLLIDQSDQPQPNALADWQQQASARQSSYPGYHLIRLRAVDYPQAEQAADWEFSYDRGGVEVHILNRNVLANARHAYALYWSVPESSWSADYHYFQAFAATFQPAGVNQG